MATDDLKKALVTMAIGDRYQKIFREHFLHPLEEYACRVGAELIIYEDRVDQSSPGVQRHVSWQKCPMLLDDRVRQFDQVCWLDADILVTPQSPSIFDAAAIDQFGITADYPSVRHRFRNDPTGYYRFFDFQVDYRDQSPFILQGGVLRFSPEKHSAFFERVYNHQYADPLNHYEQPALGYEIINSGQYQLLDPRFNFLIGSHFGWYLRKRPWQRLFKSRRRKEWLERCLSEHYFIHFAGALDWIVSS